MTKLKTLKDFVDSKSIMAKFNKDGTKIEDTFISTTDLKAEAVKWINHWRSIDQHCVKCDVWNEKRQEDMMFFFNITEEDLK